MAVITVDQVNDHLSNPPWSAEQEAACQVLIDKRLVELERWLGYPIDPIERTETVLVLASGLVMTSAPVFQLYEIDGVAATGAATYGQPLPSPYTWRHEGWITRPAATSAGSYSTRPFSITSGAGHLDQVTPRYAAGWGPTGDIVGALIEKVAATMLNRHDDTVTARALDAETPPQLKEEWTDKELMMLRSRKRPWGRS